VDIRNATEDQGVLFGETRNRADAFAEAVFNGTFLKAKPGDYVLEYGYEGAVEPALVAVSVRECRVGEVEREEGQICDPCLEGEYAFDPKGLCRRCPPHAYCDGATITPMDGHWHSTSMSPQVHSCLQDDACKFDGRMEGLMKNASLAHAENGSLSREDYMQCSAGYRGVLCGECADGYGKKSSGTCGRCLSRGVAKVAVALSFLWSVALMGYFIVKDLSSLERLTRRRDGSRALEMTSMGSLNLEPAVRHAGGCSQTSGSGEPLMQRRDGVEVVAQKPTGSLFLASGRRPTEEIHLKAANMERLMPRREGSHALSRSATGSGDMDAGSRAADDSGHTAGASGSWNFGEALRGMASGSSELRVALGGATKSREGGKTGKSKSLEKLHEHYARENRFSEILK
ncbi:unnamed protein product, partial [Ostreobium quekettii]